MSIRPCLQPRRADLMQVPPRRTGADVEAFETRPSDVVAPRARQKRVGTPRTRARDRAEPKGITAQARPRATRTLGDAADVAAALPYDSEDGRRAYAAASTGLMTAAEYRTSPSSWRGERPSAATANAAPDAGRHVDCTSASRRQHRAHRAPVAGRLLGACRKDWTTSCDLGEVHRLPQRRRATVLAPDRNDQL